MQIPEEIERLITRRLAGEISKPEEKKLDKWVQDHDAASLVNEYQKVYDLMDPDPAYHPDTEKGWVRMEATISPRKELLPSLSFGKWWNVAAAVVLLAAAAFSLYTYLYPPVQMQHLEASEQRHLILPDSSEVWLQQGAELKYAADFAQNRHVELNGEAFFLVRHDSDHPFTVAGEESRVKVLGTSFQVNFTKDQAPLVRVTTGKVAFTNLNTEAAVQVDGGQEAFIASKNESPLVRKIQDRSYQQWVAPDLTFKNAPLADILKQMAVYHGVTFDYDPKKVAACRVTISLESKSLSESIKLLELVANLQIDKNGDQYRISTDGCPSKN